MGCSHFYLDPDNDGFAADTAGGVCACGAKAPYTAAQKGDCSPFDSAINPLAPEVCDGKDNNCNNAVDEGGFPDTDNDGVKDCLDSDDDNDGTPDVSDCQPLNSAVPSCAGKQCGTDGCGKTCGTCSAKGCTVPNTSCMNLPRCQSTVGPEKSPDSLWTCTSCGDVDFVGNCWGDTTVVWCENGGLTKLDCAANGVCAWSQQYQWYDCIYP